MTEYDAFSAYGMFLAMRAHFTQPKYFYHKYNGKIRTSYDKFMQRNDRYFFHKLSRKEDPESYVLANMVKDENTWITSLLDSESEEVYQDWKRRQDSLVYVFEKELGYLEDDFNENLTVVDGQHPRLLELYLEDKVSAETMICINELTGAFKKWNSKINDTVVWPAIYLKLRKYREFLRLDEKKDRLKQVILSRFSK